MRRAALALAREVERRAPALATSKWWKEERHGVFVDYNQNAKDRTVASAYSVRPTPDARVSAPLPLGGAGESAIRRDFTLATMPGPLSPHRRPARGHRRSAPARSTPLLELSARHEQRGPGRRPLAAALPEAAGRAAAGAALTGARVQASADRDRAGAAKEDALAGLERWKARHPEAAAHLEPADVLVDAMRGRLTTWTRIRVNLQHVPAELRPAQEPLDPDEKTLASS